MGVSETLSALLVVVVGEGDARASLVVVMVSKMLSASFQMVVGVRVIGVLAVVENNPLCSLV